MLAAIAGMMTLLTACGGGGAAATPTGGATDQPTVAATLPASTPTAEQLAVFTLVQRQTQLAADRDWMGLYATYSPGQQAVCTYDAFLAKVAVARDQQPTFDASKVRFERVRVRIDGDTASVSYVELYDGQPVGTIGTSNPDVYVRIDGQWYDDVDTHKPC